MAPGRRMRIAITTDDVTVTAELNESRTALAVWNALPIQARANTWGDEIYFEISVEMPEEPDACEEVPVGTLAYWPVGNAFCIFFGPTPVSTGSAPRAYSPVNVIGAVTGETAPLRTVRAGDDIRITSLAE